MKKGLASEFAGSFFFSQPVRKPIPFLTVIPVRLLLLYHSRFLNSIDETDDICPFVLCRMNKNGEKVGRKREYGGGRYADGGAVGRWCEDGRRVGERALRVVGGADPYGAKSESRYEDERSVEEGAHSSSTAMRSPFSRRRRQGRRAEVGMLTEVG